jgi:hypothetical protein
MQNSGGCAKFRAGKEEGMGFAFPEGKGSVIKSNKEEHGLLSISL